MERIVQIIPMGIDRDRPIYLLKQFPPHKVYFIRNSNPPPEHKRMERMVDDIQKEIESLIPLAEKEYIKMDYSDFKQPFIEFLKIMKKERDEGNRVIVNLSPPSRIIAFAAWLASSLTDCEAYYIQASIYGLKGEFHSKGIAKMVRVIPFPVTLPDEIEGRVLEFLLNQKTVRMKLRDLVKEIGVENLGRVKTVQSGIVRMSYVLRELKSKGYINIKSVSRKRQEISLTEAGEIMARAVEILKK
jgi:hypothetical protein